MKARLVNQSPKTVVAVFAPGDEAAAGLLQLANEHDLKAAQITGLGAFMRARLAFFDLQTKKYEPIEVNEQVEVASIVGNVALTESGERKIHVHAVLSRRDGSAIAGHLLEGHVRPTLEITFIEAPDALRRRVDPATGLPLLIP